jgi:5-methylcytosine-specific restriction endonuclease McrA
MKRFLVADLLGNPIDESDDIAEVQRLLKESDGYAVAYCHVEQTALPSLAYMLNEHKERLDAAIRRRAWRGERLAANPRCDYCGGKCNFSGSTIDHVVPLVEGGADEPENWLLACPLCNQSKGRLSLRDYFHRVLNSPAFAPLLREMAAFAKADEPAAA